MENFWELFQDYINHVEIPKAPSHAGERMLINSRVGQMLSNFSDLELQYVEKVIMNTKYINYFETIQALNSVVDDFIFNNIDKYNSFDLLLSSKKLGSEVWLIAHVADKLAPYINNIYFMSNENMVNIEGKHFIYIDDCVYTGIHLEENLDNAFTMINHPRCNEPEIIKNELTILTVAFNEFYPYYSLSVYGLNTSLYSFYYLTPVFDQDDLNCVHQDLIFESDIDSALALYFDHKVADEMSSFPYIYLDYNLFEYPPDRSPIKDVELNIVSKLD